MIDDVFQYEFTSDVYRCSFLNIFQNSSLKVFGEVFSCFFSKEKKKKALFLQQKHKERRSRLFGGGSE